jgi:hypothetical protein
VLGPVADGGELYRRLHALAPNPGSLAGGPAAESFLGSWAGGWIGFDFRDRWVPRARGSRQERGERVVGRIKEESNAAKEPYHFVPADIIYLSR